MENKQQRHSFSGRRIANELGIIFTGGTIGCQVAEDGYLQLPDSSTYFLLEGAKKRGILDGITVIPTEPFRLFSEQMTGETLSLLVNHVRERICKEDCDGWILLHGSDSDKKPYLL